MGVASPSHHRQSHLRHDNNLCVFFTDRISCSPGWPPSHYAAEDGLESPTLLPPHCECWDTKNHTTTYLILPTLPSICSTSAFFSYIVCGYHVQAPQGEWTKLAPPPRAMTALTTEPSFSPGSSDGQERDREPGLPTCWLQLRLAQEEESDG